MGVWDAARGITLIKRNKWDRRSDLTGLLIRATTLAVSRFFSLTQPLVCFHFVNSQDPPFVDSSPDPDRPGHVIIGGFYGDVWRALQKVTNFR